MIEVICAGSLFLLTNGCLDSTSPELVSFNTTKSTLIQPNIWQNGIYLADNESESDYNRELEQLMDKFNIIIQDSSSQDSDFDADERRQELEQENGDSDSDSGLDFDNSDDFDADERRQELEQENGDSDSGNEQESEYQQQADEARDGYDTNTPSSESDS
ncbi:MAG: hypothetical protein RLZZ69_648, partial [Cyanobacteriota bacterium]